jgi:glucosamine--fructose-6-phosphate aminotransferase (isomerizing)
MCGIIAYCGKRAAAPILLAGLHNLEYRGYDSAGICVLTNQKLHILKRPGTIAALEPVIATLPTEAKIGIAHTRWATHGEPNAVNAHPHTCCQAKIAVVHNGIIENYHSLRTMLQAEGHCFRSDTDSEVLAHLIEKFYHGDLQAAVATALLSVEGTFGLAVLHQDHDQILLARRGSPLIIGIGADEIVAASDAVAILPHTRKVIYLNDDELAIISPSGYQVYNLHGLPVNSGIEEIRWNIAQIEKKGYAHFMLKEIFEQPEAIANTLRGRIKDNQIKLSLNLELTGINRVMLTGCGTSWHAGLIGKYFIEKYAGIPTEVDYASELRYRNPLINSQVLTVVISQSGETADTLAALRIANQQKSPTLGIVNAVGSTIAREVQGGIYLHAGPEIGVASTKAFSCQVVALLLLALYLRQQQGQPLPTQILNDISLLPQIFQRLLKLAPKILMIAKEYRYARNFIYLGRGLNYPVALEGALKLKEIAYIHAEGYPAAEMKHGPIALIDENMPVVCLATHGPVFEKVLSNIQEVKSRHGDIIAITDFRCRQLQALANHIISVPRVNEDLAPLINIIPLQLLAYHIAALKGLNVDKPRNLAKSVTVE